MAKIRVHKAKNLVWEQIKIGMTDAFTVRVTERMLNAFLHLSGDFNPLHADASYAATTKFKKRVIPGMLLAGFFSRLVGMHLPGKNALYLNQLLHFKRPAFVGDKLKIQGEVIRVSPQLKMITLKTVIIRIETDEILVEGEGQTLYQP